MTVLGKADGKVIAVAARTDLGGGKTMSGSREPRGALWEGCCFPLWVSPR